MKRKTALRLVKEELARAQEAFPAMHSTHEGYAVILEELDELWEEIRAGNGATHRGASEAIQTAAMAIRYLIDLCEEPVAKQHEQKVKDWMPYRHEGYGGYSG